MSKVSAQDRPSLGGTFEQVIPLKTEMSRPVFQEMITT